MECLLEKGLNPYLDPNLSTLESETSSSSKKNTPIINQLPDSKETLVIPEPIKVEQQEAVLSI